MRVWAVVVPGIQENSTWSAADIRSCRVSSSAPSGSRNSAQCSRNALTHWRVTETTTPSTPRCTRAASNRSGRWVSEQEISSPVGVARLSPIT